MTFDTFNFSSEINIISQKIHDCVFSDFTTPLTLQSGFT